MVGDLGQGAESQPQGIVPCQVRTDLLIQNVLGQAQAFQKVKHAVRGHAAGFLEPLDGGFDGVVRYVDAEGLRFLAFQFFFDQGVDDLGRQLLRRFPGGRQSGHRDHEFQTRVEIVLGDRHAGENRQHQGSGYPGGEEHWGGTESGG